MAFEAASISLMLAPWRPCDVAVLSEWELWACANELIRRYGFDAPVHAAMRADELFESGDDDGAKNFRLIIERINRLLASPMEPPH